MMFAMFKLAKLMCMWCRHCIRVVLKYLMLPGGFWLRLRGSLRSRLHAASGAAHALVLVAVAAVDEALRTVGAAVRLLKSMTAAMAHDISRIIAGKIAQTTLVQFLHPRCSTVSSAVGRTTFACLVSHAPGIFIN